MAYSRVDTHKMLNRWPVRMGERLFPFGQTDDTYATHEPTIYIQSERDMIGEALRNAFERASYHLGFYPRPIYTTQIVHFNPKRDWQSQVLILDYGKLIAFGSRSTTEIQSGVVPDYDDTLNRGWDDTATLTLTGVSAALDVDTVEVFPQVADGAKSVANDLYSIPIKTISLSGTTLTITLERADCVKPSFVDTNPFLSGNRSNRRDADKDTPNNFATGLDVYTVTTSSTNSVTLRSRPAVGVTALVETDATGVITDEEQAEFIIRLPSGNTSPDSTPYAVEVNVLSGMALANGEMFEPLETAIIRLANTNVLLEHSTLAFPIEELWKEDHQTLFNDGFMQPEYANPFGTQRGHLQAWLGLRSYIDPIKGFDYTLTQ